MKTPEASKLEFPSLEQVIPKSLDDIIREHRDRFSLRLSTAEDFEALPPMVSMLENPKQIRATIQVWRIICLTQPSGKYLILTGINEATRQAWATSQLFSVDFRNDLVLTKNSIYKLGSKGEGEPNMHILLHICVCLHVWGYGSQLGVPRIFY